MAGSEAAIAWPRKVGTGFRTRPCRRNRTGERGPVGGIPPAAADRKMARHLRIPGLLDLFTADEAASIRSLDGHPRIDRVFDPEGPLVTRLLRARIRSTFHIGGRLWPAFLSRGDAGPAEGQRGPPTCGSAATRGGGISTATRSTVSLRLLVAAEASRPGHRRGAAAGRRPRIPSGVSGVAGNLRCGRRAGELAAGEAAQGAVAAAHRSVPRARRSHSRSGERRSLLRACDLACAAEHDCELRAHARCFGVCTPNAGAFLLSETSALAACAARSTLIRGVRPLVLPADPRVRAPPPEREDRRPRDAEAAAPRRADPLRPRRGADLRPPARLQRGKLGGLSGARMGAGALRRNLAALGGQDRGEP